MRTTGNTRDSIGGVHENLSVTTVCHAIIHNEIRHYRFGIIGAKADAFAD